jgi:hypothetical protein
MCGAACPVIALFENNRVIKITSRFSSLGGIRKIYNAIEPQDDSHI